MVARNFTVAETGDLPRRPPWFRRGVDFPDLGACLNVRADFVARRAARRFQETSGATDELGEQALAATFRALARRDGNGNWARRFAGRQDISAFLDADSRSPLAVMSKELRWQGIERALNSFILRGYLTGGGGRDYDISHEALIRNWRRFQDWLRDPQEVAYSLTRVLFEVGPKTFQSEDDDKKISLIPADVAGRVAMVSTNGPLPTSWGKTRLNPCLISL